MCLRKTVYLIRHAESTNNNAKLTLRRTLKRCACPRSCHELVQLCSLLTLPMDSPPSAAGVRMIEEQRADVLAHLPVQSVVIHSHLRRARQTAVGLFGSSSAAALEVDPELYEKALSEHAGLRSLKRRVRAFQARLRQRSESVLVIVGHSAFFRALVPELHGRKRELGNLSVWRLTLGPDGDFDDLELVLPGWIEGVRASGDTARDV